MFACYILHFTNGLETRYYVGQTINFKVRLARHLHELEIGIHHNKNLQDFYNAGGRYFYHEDYSFNTKEEALFHEKMTIKKFMILNKVFNIEVGYDTTTFNPNKDKIIEKMTQSINQHYSNLTIKQKQEIYGLSGIRNGMSGKHHSEETKKKISEKLILFYLTNLNKKSTYIATLEHREKLSILASKRTGNSNPFFGRHHSEETKKKLSLLKKGTIPKNIKPVMIDDVVYESMADASRKLGIPVPTIYYRVRNTSEVFSKWVFA